MTSDTLLHRQVHPAWIQEGRITSQVFKPTPKDGRLLSVYNGDLINAENSFNHHVLTLRLKSIGVVSVSVLNCTEIDLEARPDPEPFEEHSIIDFNGNSNSDIERKSKILRLRATERDWQYKSIS